MIYDFEENTEICEENVTLHFQILSSRSCEHIKFFIYAVIEKLGSQNLLEKSLENVKQDISISMYVEDNIKEIRILKRNICTVHFNI